MPRQIPLLLLVLGGCASADEPFREHRVGTIADGARVLVPVSFSRDGRRAAYVEQRDGSCRMVCGSRTGKPYGVLC